jgi:hypothetical protein
MFKVRFKEIFVKGKTGRTVSYRGSHLSALHTDSRLVKKKLSSTLGRIATIGIMFGLFR